MVAPGPHPVTIPRRVGTSAEWASSYLILGPGEVGVDSQTGVQKLGDGSTRWCDLPVEYPAGGGGTAAGEFTHTQVTPAATWTVTHNLGAHPAARLLLDGDPLTLVETDTEYPDANTIVLTFPVPMSGRVYL